MLIQWIGHDGRWPIITEDRQLGRRKSGKAQLSAEPYHNNQTAKEDHEDKAGPSLMG